MGCLLEVSDLHVSYRSPRGREVQALAGVTFSIEAGEVLGMVGESGSGKSSLAAALLRLLPPNGRILRGSVRFEGLELLTREDDALRRIRGARIALIFQEPGLALHPAMRVGDQVGEVLRAHLDGGASVLREKTDAALRSVFGGEFAGIASRYPHELSGGQRQRVLIAQAIVCGPSVLIADEPTASLDSVSQAEILALFRELQRALGLALVLITHNPALLAGFADRILVLYAGAVVECGPAAELLSQPKHPYTRALLDCLPTLPAAPRTHARLSVIAGDPPDMTALPRGCRFEPRCPVRMEECTAREPASTALGTAYSVSCFKFGG
jgi:oligopeptide/dipeptide ABC transporter ATP-binding protein